MSRTEPDLRVGDLVTVRTHAGASRDCTGPATVVRVAVGAGREPRSFAWDAKIDVYDLAYVDGPAHGYRFPLGRERWDGLYLTRRSPA